MYLVFLPSYLGYHFIIKKIDALETNLIHVSDKNRIPDKK